MRHFISFLGSLTLSPARQGNNRKRRPAAAVAPPAEILESRELLSATSASQLAFTVEPQGGTAGQSFSVTVSIEDQSGAVVTGNNSRVTLTVASGPGRLSGHHRRITAKAVDGEAVFSGLVLDKAGTYTLRASVHHLRTTSDSFTIGADTSDEKLVFTGRAKNGTVNTALPSLKVALKDEFGNTVTSNSSDSVTVGVKTSPSGATIGGDDSETLSDGVATFDNVTLDTSGHYTLSAADTTDSDVTAGTSHRLRVRSS